MWLNKQKTFLRSGTGTGLKIKSKNLPTMRAKKSFQEAWGIIPQNYILKKIGLALRSNLSVPQVSVCHVSTSGLSPGQLYVGQE